jgi:hypothetical protein
MGNSAKRDAKVMKDRERERDACQLRKAGFSFADIAKRIGVADRSVAYNIVKRAMASIPVEAVEELRAHEMERLDDATRAIWMRVAKGDHDAINVYLRISDRRCALLGLDRVRETKGEVDVTLNGGPTPAGAAALMRELFGGVSRNAADDQPKQTPGEHAGSADAPGGAPEE